MGLRFDPEGAVGHTRRVSESRTRRRADRTVDSVDTDLRALADANGSGSQNRKVDILFGLFRQCSPLEARYLARLVLGEMRIGVGEGAVRDAICEAFGQPAEVVSRALQVTNDYGEVAAVAREEGEAGLDSLELELGRPVQSMLAQAGTAAEALDSWDEAAAEVKFDGARVQIHVREGKEGEKDEESGLGEVSIYSRNMDDVTAALPDVNLDARAVELDLGGGFLPRVEGFGGRPGLGEH